MDKSTIILSIHPNHIEKIFSGEKMYEYRKYLPEGIKYIIVYATAPIKLVVAIIEIEKIIKGNIEDILISIKLLMPPNSNRFIN